MIVSRAFDHDALRAKIIAGKITTVEGVIAFMDDMENLYKKMGWKKWTRWIDAIKKVNVISFVEGLKEDGQETRT